MIKITIAKDFSDAPGGRYIEEGPFSGELFRNEILKPKYLETLHANEKSLMIDFDGAFGYSTSFLEESFGGLTRELKVKGILKNIHIISNDDVTVQRLIEQYVGDAEKKLK